MKYIKYFESVNEPQVGDYMILNTNLLDSIPNTFSPFQTLAFYRIGEIISVKESDLENVLEIRTDYNVSDVISTGPDNWYEKNSRHMLNFDGKTYYVIYTLPLRYIIYSKNKEDLEPYIQSNKFNI